MRGKPIRFQGGLWPKVNATKPQKSGLWSKICIPIVAASFEAPKQSSLDAPSQDPSVDLLIFSCVMLKLSCVNWILSAFPEFLGGRWLVQMHSFNNLWDWLLSLASASILWFEATLDGSVEPIQYLDKRPLKLQQFSSSFQLCMNLLLKVNRVCLILSAWREFSLTLVGTVGALQQPAAL